MNEGHTGNDTDNGNSNMDFIIGNASVVAQKPEQAKKMPDSPTKRHPVQILNELRGGGVNFTMVIPNKLMKNSNEGHASNSTKVSATGNGNCNTNLDMGNTSVAAQKPKPAMKMPDNPTKRHPVQLLNELRGGDVNFTIVKSCGVTPNIIFTYGCKIDGIQYTGVGPYKKDAKKHCAMDALKILYKIQYPGTRTVHN